MFLILGKIFLYLGQREFVQCEETNDQIHGVVFSKVNKKKRSYIRGTIRGIRISQLAEIPLVFFMID